MANVMIFSNRTMAAKLHSEACPCVVRIKAVGKTSKNQDKVPVAWHSRDGQHVVITLDRWDAADAAERGIKVGKCSCAEPAS